MSSNYKNKRKRYFSSNLMTKKKKDLFLKSGIKGFICTCNGNEKQCIRESYNILNEYADQLYGEEILKSTHSDPNDLVKSTHCDTNDRVEENADELEEYQEEMKALKSQEEKYERRFLAIDTGVMNCVFIKTNVDDPVGLVNVIMKDLAEKKQLKARFLLRMVPIEITCRAFIDEVVATAAPLIDCHFKKDPLTYSIIFSKRCNSNLQRDMVIEKLASMVQERNKDHKVNLSDPSVFIIVEVIKGICGLAIVQDYFKFSKYNLKQLTEVSSNDCTNSETEPQSELTVDTVSEN